MKKVLYFIGWMTLAAASAAAAEIDAARIYKGKCKSCHGAQGEGNPTLAKKALKIDPVKLTLAPMLGRDEAYLTEVMAKGKGKMKGFEKSLSAEEIKAVLDYCRTLESVKAAAAKPKP